MLSKTEAAYKILKAEKKPLSASKIIEIAVEKGLIKTSGKTPSSTLAVDILLENRRRQARKEPFRFKKVGPATFALTEWGK